ncbi:MAG: molybdopterin-dependent oxidoreductase [Gemmatimonadetes bacterium]|nr:molybdopterin-dependent oxidoreductase [Gemmatimonadota bacterium]MYB54953.1 molybdopterin-dependent oxidoreductase [Gemmatimonadota bacterium]MYD62392.1 molybdopterin-dependent oxidoreductase [Gemmatimonadota bacterium]
MNIVKTLLVICAESETQISRQFINAAIDAKIADQVVATSFDKLEESVHTSEGIEQILVFPALIALPDAMRENLLQRIATLQNENPQTRILLTSPLGGDPRLFDMIQDRMAAALKSTQNTPILTIETSNTSRTLDFENFATLPDQVADISKLIPDRQGQGVWVREVLDHTSNADAIFYADDDRFSATVDLALVREQGLLIYGLEGHPLPASYGGPLRLIIPGHDDRCANVKGVARVEIVLR